MSRLVVVAAAIAVSRISMMSIAFYLSHQLLLFTLTILYKEHLFNLHLVIDYVKNVISFLPFCHALPSSIAMRDQRHTKE